MTGQFSLPCRFRHPREALPLLGEVPSAHTGERGLRGRTRSRAEKTERSTDISFPHRHSHSHGDPSVSLTLDSSPKRGAKGVYESRRAELYFFRNEPCRKRRNPLTPTTVIPRRAKPDVGIRFSLTPRYDYAHSQGDAVPTTILRNGLAMTGYFSLQRRFRQNREALKGSPESDAEQTGKDRTQYRPFFSLSALQ